MATITNLRSSAALEKRANRLFKVVDTVVDKARSALQQRTSRAASIPRQQLDVTCTYFDILPAELQVGIFRYCGYNDLLNLRLTSHAFKNIIDVNESVITREMLPIQEYHQLSRLFPPLRIPEKDKPMYSLKYIHFLLTRHITCHELAWYLAENAVSPIIENFQKREKRLAIQSIQTFLTPQLYLAYAFIHYSYFRLDAARATMILNNPPHMRQLQPDTLLQKYISIQRDIVTNLSSPDLIATHHCMTFLVNSIRLSLSPEPPHNQNDILVTTLLRSHPGLERILSYFQADGSGSRNGGRQLRRAFMQSMQRDREEAESNSPISFGGSGYQPKVKETWFLVAKEEMERRGLAGHEPELYTFRAGPSVRVGCPMCRDG